VKQAVIDCGGMDFVISALEEFDAGVKEGAAFVLGFTARHNLALAMEVIGAGTHAVKNPKNSFFYTNQHVFLMFIYFL
jgi:hypothetical protein